MCIRLLAQLTGRWDGHGEGLHWMDPVTCGRVRFSLVSWIHDSFVIEMDRPWDTSNTIPHEGLQIRGHEVCIIFYINQ